MEPPSPYRVLIANDSGRLVDEAALLQVVRSALMILTLPPGELSIRLTTDEEVRSLNRNFRSIDEATDVLTFPAADFPVNESELKPLGDIVIACERAMHQAETRGIAFHQEVAYLAIHGVLHLSGLDDEAEEERARMIAEMDRIGALCGLPKVADWHTLPTGAAV